MAEAFKQAKAHLWHGNQKDYLDCTSYICFAIKRSHHPLYPEARHLVESRLGGHGTVVGYLNNIVTNRRSLTHKNVQTFRHLWLDSLIKELSS
jgi:hypothetical protein